MDKEIWKDIAGYEGLYQINNYGDVKSLNYGNTKKEKILKKRIDKKGYIHYALFKNKKITEKKAHRLVAQAFIPNPENKPQINHIDGNKQNNYIKNLEWCTNSENQKHSYSKLKNISYFKYNNPRIKKVRCIEKNKTFDSIEKAKKWCGKTGITHACKNKKTCGGYHWEYI